MAVKKIETPEGPKYGKQDAWIGTNEAAIRVDGNRIKSVNFTWNKGGGEGKDDIAAGDITDDNVAVLSAPYTKGIEPLLLALLNSKEPSDDIKKRLGTGSSTYNTQKLQNMNRRAAEEAVMSRMDMQRRDNLLKELLDGYLPSFAKGKPISGFGNAATSTLGLIGGLALYIDAAGQSVNRPNIYANNPREYQALSTLSSLRDNPYQQMRAMLDVERRNRYAINQAGGLTGSQKYLANVASGIAMQRNYADILNKSNTLNNQYKSAWASAALQAGQANAARQQAANQYMDEAYAKAHAARQQLKQMGVFNMLNQIQQYQANEFKRRQFNNMYRLYAADIENRNQKKNNSSDVSSPTRLPGQAYVDLMDKSPYRPTSLADWKTESLPTYEEWKKILGVK